MSEDEQCGRWETTPAELKSEVRLLRLAIRRARLRLERGEDEPAIADDPKAAVESIDEAVHILRAALRDSQARIGTD
jgi:hypothetical protein